MEITVRFPNLGFLFEYEDRIFSVLGFDITIYGILMAVSLLIGLGMILLCARWQKLNLNLCLGASISALVGGVIGGRLYYIAFSWSQFSGKSWKILCDIRSGGISIYGAILGGVLVAALFCRLSRTSFWKMADLACMGILIGQIIGKWGSFFNRESFGEYVDNILSMQLPLTAVRAGEVTTTMRENLQMVDGVSCILVQPLFLYESLWCLLVLMLLMMHLRRRVFQGEIFLRYLAGYGLGRFVIQWMRTDKVFFPGTEIDVSLVISGVLFVLCTVIVTVKIVMAKKRARVRKRRIEKDYQAEQQAAEQRKNATENLETETVQGEKYESEQNTNTAEPGDSPESIPSAAIAGGTEESGQPDQKQERSSEESGSQSES